jgi:hypothetical protein
MLREPALTPALLSECWHLLEGRMTPFRDDGAALGRHERGQSRGHEEGEAGALGLTWETLCR